MVDPERVVAVRSWDELPDVLLPGRYCVGDVVVEVRECVSKDEAVMVVEGIKCLEREYYD